MTVTASAADGPGGIPQEAAFPCYFSASGSGVSPSQSDLPGAIDLDDKLQSCPSEKEPESVTKTINARDPLLYIFTSGTTGLPKAVNISHLR